MKVSWIENDLPNAVGPSQAATIMGQGYGRVIARVLRNGTVTVKDYGGGFVAGKG